jgi:hypothetical protein
MNWCRVKNIARHSPNVRHATTSTPKVDSRFRISPNFQIWKNVTPIAFLTFFSCSRYAHFTNEPVMAIVFLIEQPFD